MTMDKICLLSPKTEFFGYYSANDDGLAPDHGRSHRPLRAYTDQSADQGATATNWHINAKFLPASMRIENTILLGLNKVDLIGIANISR